jgi:hypothetical protein
MNLMIKEEEKEDKDQTGCERDARHNENPKQERKSNRKKNAKWEFKQKIYDRTE